MQPFERRLAWHPPANPIGVSVPYRVPFGLPYAVDTLRRPIAWLVEATRASEGTEAHQSRDEHSRTLLGAVRGAQARNAPRGLVGCFHICR